MAAAWKKAGPLLDARITLQAPVESKGSDYADPQAASYSDVVTVWAAIEPLAGREWFRNQEVGSTAEMRVTIRYLAGVTDKMRIAYGSRVLEIVAPPINVAEANVQLQLMCREYRK